MIACGIGNGIRLESDPYKSSNKYKIVWMACPYISYSSKESIHKDKEPRDQAISLS